MTASSVISRALFMPGRIRSPDPLKVTAHWYLWYLTRDCDPAGYALYLRHYSYRRSSRKDRTKTNKGHSFIGPGQKSVLITADGDALFVWILQQYRRDNQPGINCAVFRNESPCLSSDLIRKAMTVAWARWPGQRLFTYINPAKVRSSNPGCCFQKAGWRRCGESKTGLSIFEVFPNADAS